MRNTVCISRTIAQALGQMTSALQTVETHRTLYIRGKGRDEDKIGRDKRNGGKVMKRKRIGNDDVIINEMPE